MEPFVTLPFVLLFGAYAWLTARVDRDDKRAWIRREESKAEAARVASGKADLGDGI